MGQSHEMDIFVDENFTSKFPSLSKASRVGRFLEIFDAYFCCNFDKNACFQALYALLFKRKLSMLLKYKIKSIRPKHFKNSFYFLVPMSSAHTGLEV
jgi:hypothetical protein